VVVLPVEVWRIALLEQDDPPLPHDGGGAIPNQLVREGMAVTMVDTWRPVTGGVDTHLDLRHEVARSERARRKEVRRMPDV
jgi:hypothetical protein